MTSEMTETIREIKSVTRTAVLSMCLIFAPFAFAVDEGGVAKDYIYTTKPGDTLSKLAIEMLDKTGRWTDVASYNNLSNPDMIEIGQQLSFRQVWMKDKPNEFKPGKIIVEALTGIVKANGRKLKVGDELTAGDSLASEAGASLRMSLPDGSVINILEQTQLNVEKLEQSQSNIFKSLLQLVTGHVETFKKKFSIGEADLSIRSATATIGVRGTHFRMRRVEGTSYAEIEEGLVSFEADKTPQILEISGGQGSVADGEHPAEVIQLLSAPTFPDFKSAFEPVFVKIVIPEVPGAKELVGEMAQDENFSKNVRSVRSRDNTFAFAGLKDGQYWMRLRAVGERGLQGMEGKASFRVKTSPRIMEMIKAYISSSNVELRWLGHGQNALFQVQVSADPEFATVLLDKETNDNMILIPKPASGSYFVRVRGMSADRDADKWDAPVMFKVP